MNTFTPFCPWREHGGPRRTTENTLNTFTPFLSAEDAEGRGELQHLFLRGEHGGPRRTSTPFCPRRTRRDAENFNTFTPFCPRRARRTAENFNTFLSAEDAEGRGEYLLELRQSLVAGRENGVKESSIMTGGVLRRTVFGGFWRIRCDLGGGWASVWMPGWGEGAPVAGALAGVIDGPRRGWRRIWWCGARPRSRSTREMPS